MKSKDVIYDEIIDRFIENMKGGEKDGKVPVQE